MRAKSRGVASGRIGLVSEICSLASGLNAGADLLGGPRPQ